MINWLFKGKGVSEGLFRPPLTAFAQNYLVPLMPVPLLEPYLLFLVPFMIVMRVVR